MLFLFIYAIATLLLPLLIFAIARAGVAFAAIGARYFLLYWLPPRFAAEFIQSAFHYMLRRYCACCHADDATIFTITPAPCLVFQVTPIADNVDAAAAMSIAAPALYCIRCHCCFHTAAIITPKSERAIASASLRPFFFYIVCYMSLFSMPLYLFFAILYAPYYFTCRYTPGEYAIITPARYTYSLPPIV